MTPRRKRMVVIGLLVVGMGLATALILRAFNQNLMYFYSTSDTVAGNLTLRLKDVPWRAPPKKMPRLEHAPTPEPAADSHW